MSTVVKELIAKFTSDTTGLEAGAKKAAAVISGYGTAAAKAAGAAGLAFSALAIRQSLAGDEIGKIAQKYGIATDALSRLDHAAKLSDVSTQELANGFKFMQSSLVDAASGSETAARAYDLLGLKADELIKLSPEQAFERIATALASIESPALKSALATDIFGRAGTNLIPMLKDGSDGLKRAGDEAKRFGLEISALDFAALESANDALTNIGEAANGAARQFAVGLAPAISGTINSLLQGVGAAEKFREAGSNIGMIFATGFEGVARIIDWLKINMKELEIAGMMAGKAFLTLTRQDTSQVTSDLMGARLELNRMQTNYDLRKAFKGGDFNQSILKSVVDARQTAKTTTSAAAPVASEKQINLVKLLDEKTGQVDSSVKKLGDTSRASSEIMTRGFLESARTMDFLRDKTLSNMSQIGQSIGQLVGQKAGGGLFGGILGDLVGSGLSSVISGSFLGGSGFDIFKGITWNADGGVISGRSVFPSSQGMQGAGEAGPEAIMPLTRVNGKLGVKAAGGSGAIVQNITINAGVSQTVRAEMMRLMPQFKQETVRAVTEAQFRGQNP